MKVPLGTSTGEAGLVCQFRLVTVMLADFSPALVITLAVPLVTIVPDHVRLPVLVDRVTLLPWPSVKDHWDAVPLLTVQVAVAPRVTDEEQLRVMTLIGS